MGEGVLTAGFARVEGELHADGVSLERIASAAGTPAFVYVAGPIRERYRALDAALSGVEHRIHYTLKANSNRAVLRTLRELGCGVDVVSGANCTAPCAPGSPGPTSSSVAWGRATTSCGKR